MGLIPVKAVAEGISMCKDRKLHSGVTMTRSGIGLFEKPTTTMGGLYKNHNCGPSIGNNLTM
jgi:hypothetical protein